MRWGINDESTQKNITTDLCLNEIKRAQEESAGINFIVGYFL
jgi:hypothetical protein